MKIRFFYRSLNMQTRDHATIAVAKTNISGTATAHKIKRGLPTRIGKSLWSASLPFLGFLAVNVLIAFTPMPGRADEDKDRHPRHEDNDKGIRAEIAALQAQVAALQSIVGTLQTKSSTQQAQITVLQSQLGRLQTSNSVLQSQVNTLHTQLVAVQSNKALKLDRFVSVVWGLKDGVNGPHIYFTGANIHIVSGSGFTDDGGNPRGLGNLIIGYDEDPKNYVDRSPLPEGTLPLGPLSQGDRGGSHNLVIGAANRFTQAAFGGVVAGTANTIESYGASVLGGAGNTASGYGASVSGGFFNTASGPFASVSAGRSNSAGQFFTSVSGGDGNTAGGFGGRFDGLGASVSGGSGNTASGSWASVSGGSGNTAFDANTSVTGGTNNTAGSSVTFQGGFAATVVGGSGNTAGGHNTVVIGGKKIIDYIDCTIQPKAPFP
jgi:hypothetical protein